MHQQVRVKPTNSEPDVQRVLDFLAKEPLQGDEILDPDQPIGVNLVAAGGSRVELGGQFAFVPYHDPDDEDDPHSHAPAAERALAAGDYAGKAKWWSIHDGSGRLRLEWLDDRAGQLLEFVASVRSDNSSAGMRIKDIIVGTQRRSDGKVPVQLYSVPIGDADDDEGDGD